MGSVIKTISLDGRTAKIAESLPNFSQWVRSKLLELEESRVTQRTGHKYYCYKCGWIAVYSRPRTWLYCKNMNNGHCDNYEELSHTGIEVVLE